MKLKNNYFLSIVLSALIALIYNIIYMRIGFEEFNFYDCLVFIISGIPKIEGISIMQSLPFFTIYLFALLINMVKIDEFLVDANRFNFIIRYKNIKKMLLKIYYENLKITIGYFLVFYLLLIIFLYIIYGIDFKENLLKDLIPNFKEVSIYKILIYEFILSILSVLFFNGIYVNLLFLMKQELANISLILLLLITMILGSKGFLNTFMINKFSVVNINSDYDINMAFIITMICIVVLLFSNNLIVKIKIKRSSL